MFESRRIAAAIAHAFTAQPSANRKAKRIRCVAQAIPVCMAILMLLLGASHAGAQSTVAVTVTTSPAGLSFSVDGTTYTSSQLFNWNPGDTHTIAVTSPQAAMSGGNPLLGEANLFQYWSYYGVNYSPNQLSLTYTVRATADTVTAYFQPEYIVTFESPSAAEGTVSAIVNAVSSPTSPVYQAAGSSALIIASPAVGYYVSDWQLNLSALNLAQPANTYIVTINNSLPAAVDVKPVFTAVPAFIVNTNADDDATFGKDGGAANCTQQVGTTINSKDKACTLRDAVAAANLLNSAAIYFDTSVFKAGNTAAENTIYLTGDDLGPSSEISIIGPGANLLTIDGSSDPNIDDIFYIGNTDAPISISGMTIANGLAPDGGGAIYVDYQDNPGDLTVTNVVFESNVASYDPPSTSNTVLLSSSHRAGKARTNARLRTAAKARPNSSEAQYGSSGGAIWNSGTLTVTGCTFSNNSATANTDGIFDTGGAIYNTGEYSITESTFYNNSSDYGGAIDDEFNGSDGPVCLNCSVSNTSTRTGGALSLSSTKPNNTGLFSENLIQDATFSNNTSTTANSGAIYVEDNELVIASSVFANNTGAIDDGETGDTPDVSRSKATNLVAQRLKPTGFFAGRSTSVVSNAEREGDGLEVGYNVFYNNLGNESTPQEDDCTGGCSFDPAYNFTGYDTMLMPLANYGGTTPTMLPQPGSIAICMLGGDYDLPVVVPTDQRGYSRFNYNYPVEFSPCQDLGAVQTNYALAFSTEPPAYAAVSQAITPAPAVTLTESGRATTAGGTVSVTGSTVALGGTLSSSLSDGNAAFASLTVSSLVNGEILTAALPMNLFFNNQFSITAVSTPFDVTNQIPPSIVASVSSPTSFLTNSVTLTATISSGSGTPTGTVTFYDGTTPLGSGTLSGGVYNLPISTLTAGSHSITVQYSGDALFLPGTSAPVTEYIEDFTVTCDSCSPGPIVPGTTVQFTFTVAPPTGTTFPADIDLSLSGLPTGTTYSFLPAKLSQGSGSTQVTLTLNLPLKITPPQASNTLGSTLAPFSLALLLLPFVGRLRRASRRFGRVLPLLLLLGVSLAAAIGLSGCNNNGYFGTKQQSYTVTVTGKSGNLSHSAQVTFSVE